VYYLSPIFRKLLEEGWGLYLPKSVFRRDYSNTSQTI